MGVTSIVWTGKQIQWSMVHPSPLHPWNASHGHPSPQLPQHPWNASHGHPSPLHPWNASHGHPSPLLPQTRALQTRPLHQMRQMLLERMQFEVETLHPASARAGWKRRKLWKLPMRCRREGERTMPSPGPRHPPPLVGLERRVIITWLQPEPSQSMTIEPVAQS